MTPVLPEWVRWVISVFSFRSFELLAIVLTITGTTSYPSQVWFGSQGHTTGSFSGWKKMCCSEGRCGHCSPLGCLCMWVLSTEVPPGGLPSSCRLWKLRTVCPLTPSEGMLPVSVLASRDLISPGDGRWDWSGHLPQHGILKLCFPGVGTRTRDTRPMVLVAAAKRWCRAGLGNQRQPRCRGEGSRGS